MKFFILGCVLFSGFITTGQDQGNLTVLDYLNSKNEPFTPEKAITGLCFVILVDDFDYYKNPIVINENGTEVLRITNENSVVTTYRGKTYQQQDSPNTFNPWLFIENPDYFRIAFECTDTTGAFYKVRLTETDYTLIEKRNPDFKKQTIHEFVSDWTSIGFDFNRTKNPLKKRPEDKSEIISHPEQKKYKIWQGENLEIRGDWIKIKTVKDEIGWVRWRKGNTVLIRMYFAC